MANGLPAPAELYLRALSGGLWALSTGERDAIVAELRGHLAMRAAEGEEALAAALRELGPVEALARAFDHGSDGAVAPLPPSIADSRRAMRLRRWWRMSGPRCARAATGSGRWAGCSSPL
jgi:hypothetical protein